MEEKLQASLLSATRRMTTTLGRAEGHARAGEAQEVMVFLAELEKDARGTPRPWPTHSGLRTP